MNLLLEPLIHVLPIWLRNKFRDSDLSHVLEFRLRLGQTVEIVTTVGSQLFDRIVQEDDLRFCINMASKYSPWTATSLYSGYITIEGGHRIGIAACWAIDETGRRCIQNITSICIRVAKEFRNISQDLYLFRGSLLIVGPPGSGKTTLLRDLIRSISENCTDTICVIDERKEIFPMNNNRMCFPIGPRTDVLSGCSKVKGIDMAIRCMGPHKIAVDEITAKDDCDALMEAAWCGVHILATAHASGKDDLYRRPIYKPLVECNLFQGLVVINRDKSWHLERM